MLHDVLIAGGGAAGATLALGLREAGFAMRVLDARPAGSLGARDRTLALSHNARLVLERVGLWEKLASVTPITSIDISQRGRFGITRLEATPAGVPALGYVVRYAELQAGLDRLLAEAAIAIHYGCKVEAVRATADAGTVTVRRDAGIEEYRARLVVVADGSGDALPEIHRRKINYGQHAVTGLVKATAMRPGMAFERFTGDGPVALLPFEDGHALVWTAAPARAAVLVAMGEGDFLRALQSHFGDRVGRFTAVAERKSFPLTLQVAQRVTTQRALVLGNAAQTLHPVAGQGFNLALRDVWTLVLQLQDTRREDIGSAAQLAAYAKARRVDRWAGVAFTHTLVEAFISDHPLVAASRGLGLTLVDSIPPLKRAFVRTMLNGLR